MNDQRLWRSLGLFPIRLLLLFAVLVAVMSIAGSPLALVFLTLLVWSFPKGRRFLSRPIPQLVIIAASVGAAAFVLGWVLVVSYIPQGQRTTGHWMSAVLLGLAAAAVVAARRWGQSA